MWCGTKIAALWLRFEQEVQSSTSVASAEKNPNACKKVWISFLSDHLSYEEKLIEQNKRWPKYGWIFENKMHCMIVMCEIGCVNQEKGKFKIAE